MNVDRLVSFSLNDFEAKKGDFNEKFTQALKDGFFYVDIPESANLISLRSSHSPRIMRE